VDDDFIDPLAFRGIRFGAAGLFSMRIARAMVTLANAFGTGIADDKALYAYVPRYSVYPSDPILNNVETYLLMDASSDRM